MGVEQVAEMGEGGERRDIQSSREDFLLEGCTWRRGTGRLFLLPFQEGGGEGGLSGESLCRRAAEVGGGERRF